jgi:DNA-binding MarR family transcriptional regulator
MYSLSAPSVKLDAIASMWQDAAMTHPERPQPQPQTIAAWIRLITASRVLLDRIEAALKSQGLPPLGWYDALWELEQAEAGLRPFELQERLLLPQYGMSRLLDRLVSAELVERLAVEEDGRGQRVRISAKGREVRGRMWPVYAGELCRLVEAPLRDGEAEALEASLGRLIAGARRVT